MRWNETEVADLADKTPQWEGRLIYKPPKSKKEKSAFASVISLGSSSSDQNQDRWFRLRGNLLFYFRLSVNGGRPSLGTAPLGVLVLENYQVQLEGFETPYAFSIIYANQDKKHIFVASCQRHAQQWVQALTGASYQELREKLINLQITLRQKTNQDPLRGTNFDSNPLFSPPDPCLDALEDMFDSVGNNPGGSPPKAKPRKAKMKSSFQSHVVENWENHSPHDKSELYEEENFNSSGPSFKSHVPTANLIDL